jgi:hypothetical protein
MAKSKAKNGRQTTGFAPTPEDLKLLDELKEKYEPTMGPVTNAMILRMGLRALAEKETRATNG